MLEIADARRDITAVKVYSRVNSMKERIVHTYLHLLNMKLVVGKKIMRRSSFNAPESKRIKDVNRKRSPSHLPD